MVFSRFARTLTYPTRSFPVYRPPAGDIDVIDEEREKLKALIAYEEALDVFRAEVEAYYAGKGDLEKVLDVMMASGICQRLSVLR